MTRLATDETRALAHQGRFVSIPRRGANPGGWLVPLWEAEKALQLDVTLGVETVAENAKAQFRGCRCKPGFRPRWMRLQLLESHTLRRIDGYELTSSWIIQFHLLIFHAEHRASTASDLNLYSSHKHYFYGHSRKSG